MKNNRIIQKASPIIDYLMMLRCEFEAGTCTLTVDGLKEKLSGMVAAVESELRQFPDMYTKIETVKLILTAFCDEVIIFSDWTHAATWRDQSLEMALFNQNVSGEKFFEMLEAEGYRDPELAELFYTCLSLGFRPGKKESAEAKQRLYGLISRQLPADDRYLSPAARETISGTEKKLPPLFGLWATISVLVIFIGCYMIASRWLWHDAAELIHTVAQKLITKGY